MKLKSLKVQHFLVAVISILYTNETTKIPMFVTYFCIFFKFFQPLSYIFKIGIFHFQSGKMYFIERFLFYLNFSNLLSYLQVDIVSYIIFIIVNCIIYGCLILFILNTFLIRYNKFELLLSKSIELLNLICFVITYIFNSILLIPILEIFSNFIDCGWYSYITNSIIECGSINIGIKIISIFGLCFTSILCFLFLWMNRSYAFYDLMILRQKITPTVLLNKFCTIFLVCFWPIYKDYEISVYILVNAVAILSIIEYLTQIQISNKFLNIFYISSLMTFFSISVLFTFYNYANLFNELDLFFVNVLIIALMIKIGLFLFNKISLKIAMCNFSKIKNLVNELENFYYLFSNEKDDNESFKFYGLMRNHLNSCKEETCPLTLKKLNQFKSLNFFEKEHFINNFISEIFLKSLQKNISKDRKNNYDYDNIILKYCTFLANFGRNPAKAYFEMQHIISLRQTKSFYFKNISKHILHKVRNSIRMNEKSKKKENFDEKEIELTVYFEILKEKNYLKTSLNDILSKKVNFYEKYKEGIVSYEQMIKNVNLLVNPIKDFESTLEKKLLLKKDNTKKVFLLKFQIIFNCMVLNNVNDGLKIEDELDKLKKKEMTLDTTILNCNSFFYDNLVTIQASFLGNNGLILENSKNLKFSKFFNYSLEEFKSITHIGSLMPGIISSNHQKFVQNFINSYSKKEKKQNYFLSFGQEKNEFIFPVKVYTGQSFDYNFDFVFHAALLDIGLRNEKIALIDETGNFQGVTKEFYDIFPTKTTKFIPAYIKLLNMYCFLPSLKLQIEKNKMFDTDGHENGFSLINQSGTFYLPLDFNEILEVFILKKKEEETELIHNKTLQSLRSNTSKTKKSERSNESKKHIDKTQSSKFFSKFMKTMNVSSNEDRKNIENRVQKNSFSNYVILSELMRNCKCETYMMNYNIKTQIYTIDYKDKKNLYLGNIYLNSITKLNRDLTTITIDENNDKTLKSNNNEENENNDKNLNNNELNVENINSNQNDSYVKDSDINVMIFPPENKFSFDLKNKINTFDVETNKNEKNQEIMKSLPSENEYADNQNQKIFTTENEKFDNLDSRIPGSAHIFETPRNEEYFKEKENNKKIKITFDQKKTLKRKKTENFSDDEYKQTKHVSTAEKILNLNEKTSVNSSSNQGKKTFIIFNIIKLIQNNLPSVIKNYFFSQIFELILVIAFCLVVYLISNEYVSKYKEPLEESRKDIGRLYNYYAATTLLTMRAEFTQKKIVDASLVDPLVQKIFEKVFQESYDIMNEKLVIEKANTNSFEYLIYMKSNPITVSEINKAALQDITLFDFLDRIVKIIFTLTKMDFMQANIEKIEYPQINFYNLYEFYIILIDKIGEQFYKSSSDMELNIKNVMIALVIVVFFIKGLELFYLNKFSARLVRILNIFMRVNQNEAYNEILFTKEIIEILNHPSEHYITLNCTEKVVTKKTIRLFDQDNSNKSEFKKSNKNKKSRQKSNFSFHNTRSLSKTYSFLLIFGSFILLFAFFFFNFYYFEITYNLLVQEIDTGIFFRKLNAVPPTLIALNRITMREKISRNTLYDYPKTIERQKLLDDALKLNMESLLDITNNLPDFLAKTSVLDENDLRIIVYGHENENICNKIYENKLIEEDEALLCLSVLNGAFSKSLLSVLTELYASLQQELPLSEPVDYNDNFAFNAQKQLIMSSLKSSVGLDRILTEYFLMKTLFFFTDRLNQYFSNLINGYLKSLQEIDIITTVLILLIGLILLFATDKYLKKLYRNIICVLLLIPYEKMLNDEQTIFLIKKYWRD